MAPTSPAWPSPPASRRLTGWAAALIALAAFAAYAGSFSGPFVFDDLPAIAQNASLRHLASALSPPHDTTVGGRPLVNLSLALNYAISGTRVWSYHLTNLAIHILAGLALFGIVRRTLERWSALSPTRLPASGAAQRVGDNALHPTLLRPGRRPALDAPSAPNRIGHLCRAAGGVADGALLSADAVRLHSRNGGRS